MGAEQVLQRTRFAEAAGGYVEADELGEQAACLAPTKSTATLGAVCLYGNARRGSGAGRLIVAGDVGGVIEGLDP